jgi:hypothetical protein
MRKRSSRWVRTGGLVAAVVLLAACSESSGESGSCGNVQPCGGSLVGAWTLQSSCETIANFVSAGDCPGASLDQSMVTTSGSLVFNADLTYTVNTSVSGTRKVRAPLECISAASCDEYAMLFVPGPPIATTTCTTVGNTCDCTTVYSTPEVGGNDGTYSTSGTTVTAAPAGGIPSDAPFCVQGNTLYINEVDGTTGLVATRS